MKQRLKKYVADVENQLRKHNCLHGRAVGAVRIINEKLNKMNESVIIQKLIKTGQMLERGELEYSGAEIDVKYYLEQYEKLNRIKREELELKAKEFDSKLIGFFTILWIVALILWITFAIKGMITEMWITNAFMWIGFFGRILSKKYC